MITALRTHPAAAAAALAALLAACAASPPVWERFTPPPPGASLEYVQRNTGSFGKDVQFTATRGDTSWQGAPAVSMASSLGSTIVQHPQGGTWAVLARDGKPMLSFEPPIAPPFPMKVGASFTRHHTMTMHASGKVVAYDLACRVEGYEKVAVRAGTFDAFRVRCTTTIGNDETWWLSPEVGGILKTVLRRDAASPFGAGTQEQELVGRTGVRSAG
jgi:hypothetical protein